ncbi:hypothetical protein ACFXPX_27820 [Kitasatospora sp. NPDC059146]|uniref:hypothetical protein n=1 Tax=unclassified Kitasatospora TaxID=2633591 RepID=UPI003688EDFA
MKPIRIYPKYQRLFLVAGGLVFLSIAVAGVIITPIGSKVFYSFVLVFSVVWCHQGARLGLVIGPQGIVERSMGRPNRISWQDIEDVRVEGGTNAGVAAVVMIALTVRGGDVLLLRGTARYDRKGVEQTRRRILAMRAAALGTPVES